MHKVLDRFGRYYALMSPCNYRITIERKNADESYSVVYTLSTIDRSK